MRILADAQMADPAGLIVFLALFLLAVVVLIFAAMAINASIDGSVDGNADEAFKDWEVMKLDFQRSDPGEGKPFRRFFYVRAYRRAWAKSEAERTAPKPNRIMP